jgi:hypothetical protein
LQVAGPGASKLYPATLWYDYAQQGQLFKTYYDNDVVSATLIANNNVVYDMTNAECCVFQKGIPLPPPTNLQTWPWVSDVLVLKQTTWTKGTE